MTDKKIIDTLSTIDFMLKGMAHYDTYSEALRLAKKEIRVKSGKRLVNRTGRPLKIYTDGRETGK